MAKSLSTHNKSYFYKRHSSAVRTLHWLNVICFFVLFMSGLMIFNAHPSLYWGHTAYVDKAAFLTLPRFPPWITIPSAYSLADGRLWHFFFAWVFVINGFLYLLHGVFTRHIAKDLVPTAQDWRGIGRSIVDHIQFKHPQGEEAKRYNILQKLAYLVVIFVLLPVIILGGWAMSPWLNSIGTGWVDLFGGRQSARTIHFIVAWLLVGFVFIHVFEVIISGLWNHLRSMITGQYQITIKADSPNTIKRCQ
jgi:thiosulfate reductase cytochrome b subunit